MSVSKIRFDLYIKVAPYDEWHLLVTMLCIYKYEGTILRVVKMLQSPAVHTIEVLCFCHRSLKGTLTSYYVILIMKVFLTKCELYLKIPLHDMENSGTRICKHFRI